GIVVTIIGITLIPAALNNMGGGEDAVDFGSASNISLAFGTLALIIIIYRFSTGFIRSIAILIGLVGGTIAAGFMDKVHFQAVSDAGFLHMIEPFYFGTPTFHWTPILTMILVAMVSLVESTGVYFALGDITKKSIKQDDLTRGYRAE